MLVVAVLMAQRGYHFFRAYTMETLVVGWVYYIYAIGILFFIFIFRFSFLKIIL